MTTRFAENRQRGTQIPGAQIPGTQTGGARSNASFRFVTSACRRFGVWVVAVWVSLAGGADLAAEPPEAPAWLMARPQNRGAVLSWPGFFQVAGYNVYRAATRAGTFARVNEELVEDRSYRDVRLENGVEVFYRVTAVNSDGEESAPTVVEGVIPRRFLEANFRVRVEGAMEGEEVEFRPDDPVPFFATPWTLEVDRLSSGGIQAELVVDLISRVEPCYSQPELCAGEENFREDPSARQRIWGCADRIDNDGNGLTDFEDPDCRGIQGWSLALEVDPCFQLDSATTLDTIGALYTQGGLRGDGSFEKTELAAPDRNGGRQGVLSAVVLWHSEPGIVPQISTNAVLRVHGTSIPDDLPCFVRVLEDPDGLRGVGEVVPSAVTIAGETTSPSVFHASLTTSLAASPFRRGDVNDDGEAGLSDAMYLVNYLFLGGPAPGCRDAADTDDSGVLTLTDAIRIVTFLFLGGTAPEPPRALECGEDETPDALSCVRFDHCA